MPPVAALLGLQLTFLLLAGWAAPAASPDPAYSSLGQPAQNRAGAPASSSAPPEDQDKKKKKKKDKKKPQDDVDTTVFSAAVANSVLDQIGDGLEGHSQRLMLSAFDSDKMDGYLAFEDQIEAFFNKYNAFRVRFRIAQTATEGARGIVLVDVELEEIPARGTTAPIRKHDQIRFELERGPKGWKVVDLRPRGFFS